MLEAAGRDVRLGGNIGVPPLSFLNMLSNDSWVVLERWSFQLIDIKSSPHIGVCLMVVPEHLDWHSDNEEYKRSKSNLFARQGPDDKAIYFAENKTSKEIASAGQGQKVPYYSPPGAYIKDGGVTLGDFAICKTEEIKLLGRHNWQNVCAAVTAVSQAGVGAEAMRSVLTSFTGLEHRLQSVRELDGVTYYDDSFGTTPETAMVAIQAFDQPKVIILGGSDKGANYDDLAKTVNDSNVRAAVLIGDQASEIEAALEKTGFKNFVPGGDNMTEIVDTARSKAESGDIVLLSTACASFDMFKNYKDRGEQFTKAVQALA
jgi:UDP-N-acetylmuramoylalanine--D-glutamate ligase